MLKYRVKSKQVLIAYWDGTRKSVYCVQTKLPYIPIWFKVTGWFNDRALANEYITDILLERSM